MTLNKVFFTLLLLSVGFSVNAHRFGPTNQVNVRGPQTTFIPMSLKSDYNAYYAFSAGGVDQKDDKNQLIKQYVMAGMTAIFPLEIPNKYIKDDHILICSWPLNDHVQFTEKVCFDVRV